MTDFSPPIVDRLKACLAAVYGESSPQRLMPEILSRMQRTAGLLARRPAPPALDQRDAILITYADQFRRPAEKPLHTLAAVCRRIMGIDMSSVHLLPFYPYSSDDGFSVSDYRQVAPDHGSWEDIAALGQNYRLMFDAVINHSSVQHEWFQRFLQGVAPYDEYYITANPSADLSAVVRPRALPLLTRFETASGPRHVWTTYSADQVDLNYANPQVLVEIVDLLLYYLEQGAQFIRLDAIAYLWKETGTTCIHQPQTHQIIKLLRAVVDAVAPSTALITETNVPHQDNISYFGDGSDEAHLVYNFALPPLVLHAVQRESSAALTAWARQLSTPSDQTAFFNFLASHDGIGLNPARGILPDSEIDALVALTRALGGRINEKSNPDGSTSPYELNINYYDALGDPDGRLSEDEHIQRFLLAQSVLLALAGLPGIYVHSLIGSRGWAEGAQVNGHNRAINRQKLDADAVLAELDDPGSRRSKIWRGYRRMLSARAAEAAFHPFGRQEILELDPRVFAVLRTQPNLWRKVICLFNFSRDEIRLPLPGQDQRWLDLIADQPDIVSGELSLRPYERRWLAALV